VMSYRTEVHTREELLRRIMDADAHIRGHPERTERAVNTCLELATRCVENHGGHFEQLYDIS
jgi:hypothetical protein